MAQKHKLLVCITNSQGNQKCIMEKVKLNKHKLDFMLTDYITITRSNLAC